MIRQQADGLDGERVFLGGCGKCGVQDFPRSVRGQNGAAMSGDKGEEACRATAKNAMIVGHQLKVFIII
jgi:predicted  nucleic acid-binding Zn-ribbon protein